jgi:hypothetical protein
MLRLESLDVPKAFLEVEQLKLKIDGEENKV